MNHPIGILFDFNGTLVDDEHIHEQAFTEVAGTYGVPLTHADYDALCLGKTDAQGFVDLAKRFPDRFAGVPVSRLVSQKFAAYTRFASDKDILYAKAREVIRDASRYAKLGIVTAAYRHEVEALLAKMELASYFHVLITADDVTKGKPDPEGYHKGTEKLELPPSRVIGIEDTPSGVRAVKVAGLKCIAVLQTVSRENLSHADRIISSIGDVNQQLVEEMLNEIRSV